MAEDPPRVALFVTCLVDLLRPTVGLAAVSLLQDAGCEVVVPAAQTCCGQPAYNSGDSKDARELARQTIEAFEGFDYVVVPSGSCGGQIKVHFPELFADDPVMGPRACVLAERTHELLSFLHQARGATPTPPAYAGVAAYHDSCSGLRELGIKDQPRALLQAVEGLEITEIDGAETCCGFGGLFCVKYPDISGKMVDAKAAEVDASGADTLLGGDLGCLMNISGRLHRRGSKIRVRHTAEVLAGMTDDAPPIGAGPERKA